MEQHDHDGRFLRRFTAAWVLGAGLLSAACFGAAGSAATGVVPVPVEMNSGRDCEWSLVLDGELTVTAAEVRAAGGRLASHGLLVESVPGPFCFRVQSVLRPVRLRSAGFGGITGDLGLGDSVQVCGCQREEALGINAEAANQSAFDLSLADGASIAIQPGARVEYDRMSNGSYIVSGRGAVEAVDADGGRRRIWQGEPPLFGGPLVGVQADPTVATRRMVRTSPVAEMRVVGEMDGILRIHFRPGESRRTGTIGIPRDQGGDGWVAIGLQPDKPGEILLDDGTRARLVYGSTPRSLRVEVDKGFLSVRVDGIDGIGGLISRGESIAMEWDVTRRLVDVQNRGSDPILVELPNLMYGSVGVGAALQFAEMSGTTFSTAAVGEAVTLYDPRTGSSLELTDKNLLFQGGQPVRTEQEAVDLAELTLSWDVGIPLVIGGLPVEVRVSVDSQRILDVSESHRLQIQYGSLGNVDLTAQLGSFLLRVVAFRGLSVRLLEGNSVVLTMNKGEGTIRVAAGADNTSDVQIMTADGLPLGLRPGASIDWTVLEDGSLSARAGDGELLVFEAAGAGLTAPGFVNVTGPVGTGPIDVDRIPQPPASAEQ